MKPAQAGALTTPLPESCRAASSARIASRALQQSAGVGAHDVPGEGAQGHGVALQLEASHREAGRGHAGLAVGAHQLAW